MDLNSLFFHHQIALLDLALPGDLEARRWAGERADFYTGGLIKERRRLGVSSRTFDYRMLPRGW